MACMTDDCACTVIDNNIYSYIYYNIIYIYIYIYSLRNRHANSYLWESLLFIHDIIHCALEYCNISKATTA